jgi:hypothetical protein
MRTLFNQTSVGSSRPRGVPNRTGARNSKQIAHDKLYFAVARATDFVLYIEIAGCAYHGESGGCRWVKGD